MRVRKEFVQADNLAVWKVQLESGQSEGRALAAFSNTGDSIDWERTWYKDGVLYVDFGVDEHSGKLLYEYLEPDSDVEHPRPLVNITNNYGGVNVGEGMFH